MLKNFPDKEVLLVNEPGGTPIAQDIRILAQAKRWENDEMHPLTNAYLYAAARAQLLHTVVIPSLQEGKIVISDRSFVSSLAYQGEAQKLGFERVFSINQEAVQNILPDVFLYLDIDVDTAISRVFDAKGDKWETMGRNFFIDTKIGYERAFQLEALSSRLVRIDANRKPGEIAQEIQESFKKNIK